MTHDQKSSSQKAAHRARRTAMASARKNLCAALKIDCSRRRPRDDVRSDDATPDANKDEDVSDVGRRRRCGGARTSSTLFVAERARESRGKRKLPAVWKSAKVAAVPNVASSSDDGDTIAADGVAVPWTPLDGAGTAVAEK